LVEISLFRSLRGTPSRTHPPSMAYSACWRSHTSELDLALARRLSSCGRRRSPAARTLTNCTCGEGAAALLAVAKAVGEGGTLYSSPTRWRWRWHMQPAQPPTRSCLIRIWMASRLCPLSCVAGAQYRYKTNQKDGKAQRRVEVTIAKKSGLITRFFVSLFMYPLILSV